MSSFYFFVELLMKMMFPIISNFTANSTKKANGRDLRIHDLIVDSARTIFIFWPEKSVYLQ